MAAPNERLVVSARHVFYWRPDTGSRWLGPSDDRVWVPAMDWPEGVGAPPDPEAASEQGAQQQRPPTTQNSTPRRDQGAFSRGPAQPAPFRGQASAQAGMAPPGTTTRAYGNFTGPFAGTMRHRDAGLERRRDEERRQDEDRRREDETRRADDRRRDDERRRAEDRDRREDTERRRFDEETYLRDRCGPPREDHRRGAHGGPDRGKEQQLRERALHSMSVKGGRHGPQITRPVPDVDNALRRPNGHPIPPAGTAVDDDASDYGSSDADDASTSQKFRTRKYDRMARSLAKTPGGPITSAMPAAPTTAGLWGELSIDGLPEARNFVWWWSHGCPRVCAYGKFLMNAYGNEPRRRRSDGVQYIMRHASSANQGYLTAATGDATPLSRRDPRTVTRQARRKIKNERLQRESKRRSHSGVSGTPTTESSLELNYDDNMIPPPPPAQWGIHGSPPTPGSMTAHWLGPQMSLHDAMAHAATQHPMDWVRGTRTAAGTWPTAGTPVGTFPNVSDLRAARLLHFLAPPYDGQGSLHRIAWMESVLRGFSVWGLFERHVQFGPPEATTIPN
ncbi:hypothetical protein K438DRAFT_1969840 [Mycena galopus ATCC 62051]|nr:hypothetical protein K438DRAFT_1969840 [Mycena galopus ATCC 62051]